MAVYDFQPSIAQKSMGAVERQPLISSYPNGLPDRTKRVELLKDPTENVNVPEDVKPVYEPGFYYLDAAILAYFSNIRIPTKDSYRQMDVKIAGGDKTILTWKEDLQRRGGRIRLPVMSINRTAEEFNPEKFSPPYMSIAKRFATTDKTRLEMVYRPTPSLVTYQLSIWGEHKRDVAHAFYDIRTRFNPLAEIYVDDKHMKGSVQLRYGGMSDVSDKEAQAAVRANVRYDVNFTAEAWLPLSTKLMPSILGRVTQFAEIQGETFGFMIGERFHEPTQ